MPTFSTNQQGFPNQLPNSIISLTHTTNPTDEIDFLSSCTPAFGPDLEDNCAVCMMPLTEEPSLHNPKCSHVLHKDCMQLILETFNKCPHCRTPWDSEKEERMWAGTARKVYSSLREDEQISLDLPNLPRFEERIGEILAGSVRVLAWSMQQDFPTRFSPYDGEVTSALAFREEEEMRRVANSLQGSSLLQCLVNSIAQVQAEDLRACALSPEDEKVGLKVHWCTSATEEGKQRGLWQTDVLCPRALEGGRMRELEEDYVDVWMLAGEIVMGSVMDWGDKYGKKEMSVSLLRLVEKVVVWSLMGCVRKLGEIDAAAATTAGDDSRGLESENFNDDWPAEALDEGLLGDNEEPAELSLLVTNEQGHVEEMDIMDRYAGKLLTLPTTDDCMRSTNVPSLDVTVGVECCVVVAIIWFFMLTCL